MRDIAYIVLTVGFFGLAALFVAACDRIVGPDPTSGAVEGGEPVEAPIPVLGKVRS